MIVTWRDLPEYARPFSEKIVCLDKVSEYRNSFDNEDIKTIKSKFKVEVISEDEQKLNDFRKKIYNIHTDIISLSDVFVFCFSELQTIVFFLNNKEDMFLKKKLEDYLACFNDLKKVKDILNIISEKPFNTPHYRSMLLRLTSPYKYEMCSLIKLTQSITKIFSVNNEDSSVENEILDALKEIDDESLCTNYRAPN